MCGSSALLQKAPPHHKKTPSARAFFCAGVVQTFSAVIFLYDTGKPVIIPCGPDSIVIKPLCPNQPHLAFPLFPFANDDVAIHD
ncbi:hypothetical protein EM595_0632 [Duffyella gerundensis]|uniref:Uncharacterized protein n=1 Tax=Duffyella gerundensis TaxID=1619313 RepID=A0A0U5L183_9GAMM|nr:hypothetical protein EM595_0632 [Duffyella gerundensis]